MRNAAAAALVLVLVLAGCSSDPADPDPLACDQEGRAGRCYCDDGAPAVMVCTAGRWGACRCASSDAGADAAPRD